MCDGTLFKMHFKSVSLNIGSLADGDPDARTIFVSGLDWTVGESELQEHFGLIGQIIRITVLKDRFTGCSKGCAYIQVIFLRVQSELSHGSAIKLYYIKISVRDSGTKENGLRRVR